MKSFRINNKIEIISKRENTPSGFRHRATLMINGRSVDHTTVHYQNRTWESYEYETVMKKLIDKTHALTMQEKAMARKWLSGDRTDWTNFQTTSMVAKLGDIMTKNKKESNVWKTRMLKAGLGNKGLSFPEGFEGLSESTKKARLDKVIKLMSNKPTKKGKKKTTSDWIKRETKWM